MRKISMVEYEREKKKKPSDFYITLFKICHTYEGRMLLL